MRASPSLVLAPDLDVALEREEEDISDVRPIAGCQRILNLSRSLELADLTHSLIYGSSSGCNRRGQRRGLHESWICPKDEEGRDRAVRASGIVDSFNSYLESMLYSG